MPSVWNSVQILSCHNFQCALCGLWNQFSFLNKFSFPRCQWRIWLGCMFHALVIAAILPLVSAWLKISSFFETGKTFGPWLLLSMRILRFRSTLSLTIYISVRALRHGNAFSHFCFHPSLAVLLLLCYGSAINGRAPDSEACQEKPLPIPNIS